MNSTTDGIGEIFTSGESPTKLKSRVQRLRELQDELAKLLVSPSPNPEDEGTVGNTEIKDAMVNIGTAITEILIQSNIERY